MPHTLCLKTVVDRVYAARQSATPLPPFTQDHPSFDLAQAYAVAQDLHLRYLQQGAVFIGRKIGFTNADMWAQFGVTAPIWGPMYEHTRVQAVDGKAQLALAPFHEPRIEPELVFHFWRSPPANADVSALLSCIDWMAHGFEVVQSHYPGWRFQASDAVADGSLHGALVLGAPLALADLSGNVESAIAEIQVDLLCNAQLKDQGSAAQVLGNPLRALLHLQRELALQGAAPIAAGEIITTGTMTMAWPVSVGHTWSTQLQGLPVEGLSVSFV